MKGSRRQWLLNNLHILRFHDFSIREITFSCIDLLQTVTHCHNGNALQVISLCEKKRDPPLEFIMADTPGQIEIFTWSASGSIITQAFASSFPTMIAYVIDTPRCMSPQTFMSNMLQVGLACTQPPPLANNLISTMLLIK